MYTCDLCGVVFDIGDGKSTKEGSMCNTCYYHVYNEDDDFDPLAEDENFWGDYRMEAAPFFFNNGLLHAVSSTAITFPLSSRDGCLFINHL